MWNILVRIKSENMNSILKSLSSFRNCNYASLHTSSSLEAWSKSSTPKKFLDYNKKVYPPQEMGAERRPAFVCHQKTNMKYSPEKLWYIACFVRGMTVDEAIKQLSFVNKKGAVFVKEAILEAQELAVTQHNVEYKSNLWIESSKFWQLDLRHRPKIVPLCITAELCQHNWGAESFSNKGTVIKGIRRHARGRMGEVRYTYCHYFVRLEEGKPPKDYYNHNPLTPQEQLDKWLDQMRMRKVINSY